MKPYRPGASLLYMAFERSATAWSQASETTRGELNPQTCDALDIANAIRVLRDLRAYGGATALRDLAKRARDHVEASRASARLSPKSDGGFVPVQWARQGLDVNESSRWIAEKIAQSLSRETRRDLKLGPQQHPSAARIAKATKAIEKHRRSTKSLTDREGDVDRIARVCVQHALEAFGLSVSMAKVVAGLKRVPLAEQKRKRA